MPPARDGPAESNPRAAPAGMDVAGAITEEAMSVVIARVGIPFPGKQAEALAFAKKRAETIRQLYGVEQETRIRIGGPVGQVLTVTRHKTLGEVEEMKRKVVADTTSGKIPTAPAGVFQSSEEQIWLVQ